MEPGLDSLENASVVSMQQVQWDSDGGAASLAASDAPPVNEVEEEAAEEEEEEEDGKRYLRAARPLQGLADAEAPEVARTDAQVRGLLESGVRLVDCHHEPSPRISMCLHSDSEFRSRSDLVSSACTHVTLLGGQGPQESRAAPREAERRRRRQPRRGQGGVRRVHW
jgi:hypothetical protein